MAHIPTQKRIKEVQAITKKAIANKTFKQKLRGKDFIPHGGGVLPEKVWREQQK